MVGMVQPRRRVEHQPGETLARDGGHLGGHPASHRMSDEVRAVEAERGDEAQIVDDHVLHAGEMRGRIAFAETRMEGQEDAEAAGEAARPVVALRACRRRAAPATGGPSPMAFTTVRTPSMSRVCVSNSIMSSRNRRSACVGLDQHLALRGTAPQRLENLREPAPKPIRSVTSACGENRPGPSASRAVSNSAIVKNTAKTIWISFESAAKGSHSSPPTHRPTPTTVPCTRTSRQAKSISPLLPTHSKTMSGRAPDHRLDLGLETGAGKREPRGADRGGPLFLMAAEVGDDDVAGAQPPRPERDEQARSARRRAPAPGRPASCPSA